MIFFQESLQPNQSKGGFAGRFAKMGYFPEFGEFSLHNKNKQSSQKSLTSAKITDVCEFSWLSSPEFRNALDRRWHRALFPARCSSFASAPRTSPTKPVTRSQRHPSGYQNKRVPKCLVTPVLKFQKTCHFVWGKGGGGSNSRKAWVSKTGVSQSCCRRLSPWALA